MVSPEVRSLPQHGESAEDTWGVTQLYAPRVSSKKQTDQNTAPYAPASQEPQ